jgi:hypothetical protein
MSAGAVLTACNWKIWNYYSIVFRVQDRISSKKFKDNYKSLNSFWSTQGKSGEIPNYFIVNAFLFLYTIYDSKQDAGLKIVGLKSLYFKVIFGQNEIQYFTTHSHMYTTQRESICDVGGRKDYPSKAKHDKETS